MNISRLRAQNFKSFDTVDVELGDFNVLIGANASGKSNFLSLLTFLRDIAKDGVEDAVAMQSGEIELLRNVQLGGEKPTSICVETGHGLEDPGEPPELGWGGFWEANLEEEKARLSGSRYEIELQYDQADFRIASEEAKWGGYFREKSDPAESGSFEVQSTDHTVLRQQNKRASRNGNPLGTSEANASLLRSEAVGMWPTLTRHQMLSWQVYDFECFRAVSKEASQFGKSELAEDGRNVVLVLRLLLKNEEKRRKFLNLATTLLPFVEDLNVERLGGQSLLMTLQESHAEGQYLPSSLLSEGTIRVVALLIALYFENKWVMAFEEPATSLHPKLISRLVQMMKEVAEDKQIFVTTHNPEVIKHVDLDDLYLVSRDENGFSQITKPSDSEVVHSFLENELGLADLFVDDLLSL